MLCVQWIFIFVLDVNTYSQREHLKQFRHDFCFTNILVCTGYEQLFTERTLKPISSYFVSYEYSALRWMWTIIEVQLLNWIMKIKLVNISLSPIVEVCKKKHSFKKQNFKENCQFDKCHIVTFLKVKTRGSANPRSLLVSKMCEL